MKPVRAIKIDHVAVQTSDIEKALSFYVGIVGAELLERREFKKRRMAWLRVADTRIELFSVREGEALATWNDFLPGTVHLAFVVDDLDDFLLHAKEMGAKLHPSHPEPFIPPVPGAVKIAYLLGPDGEEVEVRPAGL